jgi:hypothetical protein
MTLPQQLLAGLSQLAMIACLIGLVRSGRWRLCYGFAAYVAVILTLGPLTTWGPEFFRTWRYWSIKQTAYDAVKLVMVVELAGRICREFPGAKAVTSRWVLAVLLLTAGGIILSAFSGWPVDFLLFAAGELHARAVLGTLWLLAATVVLVRHYRLIVHPHHMGILVGFGAYTALFGALLRLMHVQGWSALSVWSALDPPAYVALTVWFAWMAWRPDGVDADDYETVIVAVRERVTA